MGSLLADRTAPRVVDDDSAFRILMRKIAAERDDILPMGGGDPDFHTPRHVVEAAKAALDANQHHYTGPTGLPALREAIAATLHTDFGLNYADDEIIVTAGVQESIMLCLLGLCRPGDEVLITSPRFTTYDTAVQLCGGVPIPVPTHQKDGFALDVDEIAARITPKTRVFVLVSPSNPTGAVTPPATIRKIAELALQHDLLIIADEIYAKLIYPPHEHLSIATLPGLKDRTITLNGFSKTYAMTGWRVGYMAAPADFVEKLTEPRHALSINTCTVSQHAALAALTGPQDEVEATFAAYSARRETMLAALTEIGLSFAPPGGAFYVYPDISVTGMTAKPFCEALLRETGVLVQPGDLFGDPESDHVRMSFLQPEPVIREAMGRIAAFIAAHPGATP